MTFDQEMQRRMACWTAAGIRPYDFWVKPLGLNNIYGVAAKGKRFVTTEGRVYKKHIADTIAMTDAFYGWPILDAEFLELTFIFFYPHTPPPLPQGFKKLPKHQQTILRKRQHVCFFFGNGNLQPHDISNFFKLIEDEFAKHFGIDDRHNITVRGYKRPHDYNKPRIVVLVSEAKLDRTIMHSNQTLDWEALCELRSLI